MKTIIEWDSVEALLEVIQALIVNDITFTYRVWMSMEVTLIVEDVTLDAETILDMLRYEMSPKYFKEITAFDA